MASVWHCCMGGIGMELSSLAASPHWKKKRWWMLIVLLMFAFMSGVGSEQKKGNTLTPHTPNDSEATADAKSDKEAVVQDEEQEKEDDVDEVSDEVRLVRHLLHKYAKMGKIARPTYNSSTATPVWFGLRLISLELDEREQLMRSSVWVRYRWIDEYLRWDPADFGGLSLITLPWDKVWIPDIVLVNTASTSVAERPADIMVSAGGGVFWSPHRMYKSGCLIDISNFPFDHHHCDLWFQSMSHYSWHLDLHGFPGSPWDLQTYLDSYKESQGWEIVRNNTDRFDAKRKPTQFLKFNKRVALLFSLTVKRRPGYTCHLLMLPCIFLGALTLVVFCLPAERPDRITLAMSLFASFLVLLLILVEAAPPTAASVPQLGVYYACNMVLIISSVFLSASVVNVARGGEARVAVPKLLRFIFLDFLSRPLLLRGLVVRILGPRRPTTKFKDAEDQCPPLSSTTAVTEGNGYQTSDGHGYQTVPGSKMEFGLLSKDPGGDGTIASGEDGQVYKCLLTIEERLHRLENNVSIMRPGGKQEVVNEHAYRCAEWRMVSIVMDRLYFCIYIVALILSAVIFFPKPAVV